MSSGRPCSAATVWAWHTQVMNSIRHVVLAFAEDAVPRGTVLRVQLRISVEAIVTAALTALAVALAVGYQVLRFRHLGDHRDRL
jgi:hypothetical protein